MTNPHLALEGASYVLPDGRALFSEITAQFDQQPTGLVGRNGVGKSLLARILAGELAPAAGGVLRSGPVHYLAQQVSPDPYATVATLAAVQPVIDALARIENGSVAAVDFDIVGDRWDIRQRLRAELDSHQLGYLDIDRPAATLSGGEAMRVALVGAFLIDADFLILDEPTNHLDRANRQMLMEQLRRWPNGLLVISHDRALLEQMSRIVELSSLGLRSYGGGYSFYAQCKAHEREEALRQLAQRKHERKREEQTLQEQRERQERRQARGNQQGRDANQAKILLGRQKERSESTSARFQVQQLAAREQLSQRVRDAAQQVEEEFAITLYAPAVSSAESRRVATLSDMQLPFGARAGHPINLSLHSRQRVGVTGPNGCGKSTLLRVMASQLAPLAGQCDVRSSVAYLDQHLTDLHPHHSTLAQLQAVNSSLSEGELRTRLAQLGLPAEKALQPVSLLSGGERLKAALACALYSDNPAQILLLDEPSNHLDLASVQALEAMLLQYRGALLVVSHDEIFLDRLMLSDRLHVTTDAWSLVPWSAKTY